MSSGTTTRGQLATQYERLRKRANNVTLPDGLQKDLVSVAKAALDMYPITSPASAAAAMPDAEEVEELIKSLLPSPVDILNNGFFRAPLFALVTLHNFVEFYGCKCPQEPIYEMLCLSDEDKGNKNVAVHVWFADFIDCDCETILAAVDRFKSTRRSSDLMRRLDGPSSTNNLRMKQNPSPRGTPVSEIVNSVGRDLHSGSVNRENQGEGHSPRLTEARTLSPAVPSDMAESDFNDSRKATNVFNYFKDNKFTGDLSQSIDMTLRDFNVCARQHRLSDRQKADFFINALAGPARTFFFNNSTDTMDFEEMAKMMVFEYNSDARQLQVQGRRETLRLERHMSEQDVSNPSEGLTQIIDIIERLTPQCQPQFRSDADKINYLRKAVMGFSWAMTPIGNIIAAKYTFNGFVTAVREHLQLENEVKMSSISAACSNFVKDGTFHQQYGRHPKFVQKYGTPTRLTPKHRVPHSSDSFSESRRKGICHRCKEKWHPGHRCKHESIRNYVRDRLRNGDAAVQIVLDLVLRMEGDASDDVAPSAEDEQDARQMDVRFCGNQDELAVFDDMVTTEETVETRFMDNVDKEWFTNNLSASLSAGDSPKPNHSSDFGAGDDQ